MTEPRYDLDIYPPDDTGPFMPEPEFYAALDAVANEVDLEVRFYAAVQVIVALEGAAVKSEAARNSVELVNHILANELVSNDTMLIFAANGSVAGVDVGEDESFGDQGVTANLILEIVALEEVIARRSALIALALQTATGVYGVEPYSAALHRYIKRSRGELLLRVVSPGT
jgi:hypothetical protein